MGLRLALAVLVLALASACSGGDTEPEVAETTTVTVTETVTGSTSGSRTLDSIARIPQVVDKVDPSVVAIVTDGGEGSGVIWGARLIVTNNHVVDGASQIEVVLASGERLPAKTRATDPLSDLALLEVDRDGLPPATFARKLPKVGQLALAIGNPQGLEQSASLGIVSGLHRAIPSGGTTPELIDLVQTDAAISPGNSGGALVDIDGDVIGINVAYIPPQQGSVSIGFAIPGATVVSVVRQLLESGRVERAYLGVTPFQVTAEMAAQFGLGVDEGVGIESVQSGRAAEQAGIRGGDVIVELGGRETPTVEDLFAELRNRGPGDEVQVVVVRDGERRSFTVTLDERP